MLDNSYTLLLVFVAIIGLLLYLLVSVMRLFRLMRILKRMEVFAKKLQILGYDSMSLVVHQYIEDFSIIMATHSVWVPIERYRYDFYKKLNESPQDVLL